MRQPVLYMRVPNGAPCGKNPIGSSWELGETISWLGCRQHWVGVGLTQARHIECVLDFLWAKVTHYSTGTELRWLLSLALSKVPTETAPAPVLLAWLAFSCLSRPMRQAVQAGQPGK